LFVASQQGSTSLIQRKMKIGYNRAGRIVDQLESAESSDRLKEAVREVLLKLWKSYQKFEGIEG
jgi:S-DNA-T family DNA segregation ATPase FtsK/SpoIIIE